MPTNKKKIADLLIRIFPYDNGEDYHTTFELVNNTFSPFQQVDDLMKGIFEDVGLMNEINSNDLKDEKQIKNRKERIYTNGKIIHRIYKIKKSNNKESNVDEENDANEESDQEDSRDDYDRNEVDDESEGHDNESEEVYDDDVESMRPNRPRSSKRRGGNKNNKKQNRKTKKHSKK